MTTQASPGNGLKFSRAWARGVDVSHWKPVKNWGLLKESGVSFFATKATEGLAYRDPTLKAHRDGARKTGFDLVMYYHFARPGSASEQARHLVSTVGELAKNERLVLDVEQNLAPDNPQSTALWCLSFFAELSQLTKKPGVLYTSKRIWKMIGNPPAPWASTVSLWIPGYRPLEIGPPKVPPPWETLGWRFWQWTDGEWPAHQTPGIGRCDANYFAGTREQLQAFANGS